MSEPVKITPEELSELKLLETKFQESVWKFGNLQIEKLGLDRLVTEFVNKEKTLKEEWESLQKLEQNFLDKINQKYGNGNLSMKDGTFYPETK